MRWPINRGKGEINFLALLGKAPLPAPTLGDGFARFVAHPWLLSGPLVGTHTEKQALSRGVLCS